MLATRTAPWFALALLLCIAGFVAFGGTAQAMLEAAAMCVALAAAIRYVGLAVRDDPVRSRMVTRRSLDAGAMSVQARSSRRRRRDASEREERAR